MKINSLTVSHSADKAKVTPSLNETKSCHGSDIQHGIPISMQRENLPQHLQACDFHVRNGRSAAERRKDLHVPVDEM